MLPWKISLCKFIAKAVRSSWHFNEVMKYLPPGVPDVIQSHYTASIFSEVLRTKLTSQTQIVLFMTTFFIIILSLFLQYCIQNHVHLAFDCINLNPTSNCNIFSITQLSLKPKRCHNANFVISVGTGGCHNDSIQCHQWPWPKSWHYNGSHFQYFSWVEPIWQSPICG